MKKYTLDEVYTADMTAFQRERYNRVADEFEKLSLIHISEPTRP